MFLLIERHFDKDQNNDRKINIYFFLIYHIFHILL